MGAAGIDWCIMEYKTRGTILRSRARWHEHGERNNKYFYSLEKRNYSRKLVSKLKLNDGSFTTNQFEILEEQKTFYQSLYQSQLSTDQDIHDGDIFLNLNNIPTLADDEQTLCEGLITEGEAFNALKRDSWRQWSKVGNKFLKAPLFFCVVVGLLGEWTKKAILRASDVSLPWQPQSNIPAPSSYFEQKFHSQEVNINEPCSRAHLNQFKWKSARV